MRPALKLKTSRFTIYADIYPWRARYFWGFRATKVEDGFVITCGPLFFDVFLR